MAFLPFLSPDDFSDFHRTVASAGKVRNHFDALVWLQGDMQLYLPHDILIAAWGDFSTGCVHHDILSTLPGVRSQHSNLNAVTPLLLRLFNRWAASTRDPIILRGDDSSFVLEDTGLSDELAGALKGMRCAMVHGITDKRDSHDCIYVIFSTRDQYNTSHCGAMSLMLPYMDTALRQVAYLPHQIPTPAANGNASKGSEPDHGLTGREIEILKWVRRGKTNPEIGTILEISEFTVKNHLQRVFKKLDVYSRAQAVGKINSRWGNV